LLFALIPIAYRIAGHIEFSSERIVAVINSSFAALSAAIICRAIIIAVVATLSAIFSSLIRIRISATAIRRRPAISASLTAAVSLTFSLSECIACERNKQANRNANAEQFQTFEHYRFPPGKFILH
jgi:hypothetical protein